VKVSEIVPKVGIAEPFAARRDPDGCSVFEKERGRMDTHDPVSMRKARLGIGRVLSVNFAFNVKRPQHNGSLGSAALTGDDISFF